MSDKPEVLSRPIHVLHQDKTNVTNISDENLNFMEKENQNEIVSGSLSIFQEKLQINCNIDAFPGKFKRLPGHVKIELLFIDLDLLNLNFCIAALSNTEDSVA